MPRSIRGNCLRIDVKLPPCVSQLPVESVTTETPASTKRRAFKNPSLSLPYNSRGRLRLVRYVKGIAGLRRGDHVQRGHCTNRCPLASHRHPYRDGWYRGWPTVVLRSERRLVLTPETRLRLSRSLSRRRERLVGRTGVLGILRPHVVHHADVGRKRTSLAAQIADHRTERRPFDLV